MTNIGLIYLLNRWFVGTCSTCPIVQTIAVLWNLIWPLLWVRYIICTWMRSYSRNFLKVLHFKNDLHINPFHDIFVTEIPIFEMMNIFYHSPSTLGICVILHYKDQNLAHKHDEVWCVNYYFLHRFPKLKWGGATVIFLSNFTFEYKNWTRISGFTQRKIYSLNKYSIYTWVFYNFVQIIIPGVA